LPGDATSSRGHTIGNAVTAASHCGTPRQACTSEPTRSTALPAERRLFSAIGEAVGEASTRPRRSTRRESEAECAARRVDGARGTSLGAATADGREVRPANTPHGRSGDHAVRPIGRSRLAADRARLSRPIGRSRRAAHRAITPHGLRATPSRPFGRSCLTDVRARPSRTASRPFGRDLRGRSGEHLHSPSGDHLRGLLGLSAGVGAGDRIVGRRPEGAVLAAVPDAPLAGGHARGVPGRAAPSVSRRTAFG
jgi:hypothetical protein